MCILSLVLNSQDIKPWPSAAPLFPSTLPSPPRGGGGVNLTKGRSGYTRIWNTLWLFNFDRFCQHSSIADADEICDMAAVRGFSRSDEVIQIFNKQHAKNFPQVKCLREEKKDFIKIWLIKDVFATLPTTLERVCKELKDLNRSTLSSSNVSNEWKSRRRLHNHGGLRLYGVCLALEAIGCY